ncbi:MAG: UDP-N-acetylmuramoylalanine--D-glutamate ligase [Deltaproteobacteria bacterium RBG_13_47_9]|nr:MAG: UDP-N-acetylmuramoylalanine--D-glutamate ligase [Deltaproteobacteria bacterium RBG_13_47_9]
MDLNGRRVLVVGLARTGLATVRFLKAKGSMVSTTEANPKEQMKDAILELNGMDIQMEWGGHQTETFLKQDLIVVSPGVDLRIEPIQKALEKDIRVISEVELAYRFIQAPMIAITGTNGKTTTTLLIGEMLKEEGKKVGVGGNVGDPLILFAEKEDLWEVLVAEISSFQLEAIEEFRPRLSVLLNITEDHLDRYSQYPEYIEVKARIFKNQPPDDVAVLNKDDPVVLELSPKVKAKKIFFSLNEGQGEGVFSDGQTIFFRLGAEEENYSLVKTPLKGIHNVENMMAAVAASRTFGCSKKTVETVLNRFKGLEHRLEFVQEIKGVRFYDDSKGTNVGSVVKSLQSFQEPVILIAGGKDKKGDLSPLRELIQERVKRLILIGEAKERMARELGGLIDTSMAETLEEAVLLAFQAANQGEVILLSPACSSFDMFKDYKERGKVFKETVHRLQVKS